MVSFNYKEIIYMYYLNLIYLMNTESLLKLRSENVERKRAASKVRVVNHREKVYSNPELLEEYRRKERERLEQDIFTLCVRERERE